MTKILAANEKLIVVLLFTLICVSGCDRGGKSERKEQNRFDTENERHTSSRAGNEKPDDRGEIRIGNSTYYIEKGRPVNTQILEIAMDSDDQAVINDFLQKARSGDANAKEAMRTANPKRFISLAKRGKYDIDAQALKFLKIMEGFGNTYAREAIKAVEGGEKTRRASNMASEPTNSRRDKTHGFTYSGLSPIEAHLKAEDAAIRWKPTATLQAVFAEKWNLYGDASSREVTGIQIPEWRFVYIASGKVGSFIVTEDDTKLAKEENVPASLPPDSPLASPHLEDWKIDAGEALEAAFEAGVPISQGPWLWMRKVQGRWEPIWIVPSATGSHFVSAKTGEVLSKQSDE